MGHDQSIYEPGALPQYPKLPHHESSDELPWTQRHALKVQWPTDMDRESRTAP